MKIAIIAAMDEEVILLKKAINHLKTESLLNVDFYTGTINGCAVVLLKSGIGKVASSSTTTLLINHFNVDAVINTGSACGLDSKLKVGDIVLSTACVYHDVDLTAFDYKIGQMASCPEFFKADENLQQIAMQSALQLNQAYQKGMIATGDVFVSDDKMLTQIKSNFSQVIAVDMEATAIAHVCWLYKIPFVVVRSISDNGDKSSSISFKEFLPLAAKNSSALVEAMLIALKR